MENTPLQQAEQNYINILSTDHDTLDFNVDILISKCEGKDEKYLTIVFKRYNENTDSYSYSEPIYFFGIVTLNDLKAQKIGMETINWFKNNNFNLSNILDN